MTNTLLTEKAFSDLPLHDDLLRALTDAGLTHCTPIQAETLPLMLTGRDIAGQAQTGTGKTAAFLLATFNRLINNPPAAERRVNQPRALMIAPTRELAIQIHKDALLLNKYANFRISLVYGGVDYDKQRDELREGVDILIGTPGRLIDYFKQKVYDLKAAEMMVLDEADRMFDLGFIKDVRYLLRRLPPVDQRQGLLFSATLPYKVTELAYEHMNNPELIKVNPDQVTADKVTQVLYHVSKEEKIPLLLGLLKQMDPKRTILFVNTKHVAEKVWGYLEGNGFQAAILSGDVPQNKRQKMFQRFSDGELAILVATDVASRGLHIPNVSHVFNYDLPQNAEDYVHRIGRTARAGEAGDAVSLACEEYVYSLMEIEEYIGYKLPTQPVSDEMLETNPAAPVRRERSKPPAGRSGGGQRRGGGGNRRSGSGRRDGSQSKPSGR
ncbi:ATP-dependent RNA helicase RhlB [Methylohalomonas lacus]|uniref:ATP-dependent RNA helicase RhlB n=1 Tax=Methylohalomonas lacus TaxID=398773 RepID=A0AAE3L467_9GAMM|nr:ATP-dependent RNA helicase RhlB [Methylohalomonas lacus]MCS3903398.1 ATP-dependent RNA helicase RhlB [Methylohalomonas lacus]